MIDLINFTHKEYTCVGKLGEISIVSVMQYFAKNNGWDLVNDHIELTSDHCPYDVNCAKIPNFVEVEAVGCSWNETALEAWKKQEKSQEDIEQEIETLLDESKSLDNTASRYQVITAQLETLYNCQ